MYLCQIELIAEADIFFEILHHTLKLSKPFVTLYQISVTFAPPAVLLLLNLSFFQSRGQFPSLQIQRDTKPLQVFIWLLRLSVLHIFTNGNFFSTDKKNQNSNGLSITDDIDSCNSPKACFQFQPCGPRTLAFGQKAGESSVHLMEVKLLRNTSGVLLIKLFM